MYIPHDNTQNYHFCKVQLVVETFGQLNEPTNQNSLKIPKVVKPTNEKTLLQNFGKQLMNKQHIKKTVNCSGVRVIQI